MPATKTSNQVAVARLKNQIVKLMFKEAIQSATLDETKRKIAACHGRIKALERA